MRRSQNKACHLRAKLMFSIPIVVDKHSRNRGSLSRPVKWVVVANPFFQLNSGKTASALCLLPFWRRQRPSFLRDTFLENCSLAISPSEINVILAPRGESSSYIIIIRSRSAFRRNDNQTFYCTESIALLYAARECGQGPQCSRSLSMGIHFPISSCIHPSRRPLCLGLFVWVAARYWLCTWSDPKSSFRLFAPCPTSKLLVRSQICLYTLPMI